MGSGIQLELLEVGVDIDGKSMGLGPSTEHLSKLTKEEKEGILSNECTLQKVAEYVKERKDKGTFKVCLCTGAGISVSAGIPDFRTPGTGLYDNLQKYDLPKPEAIFDINFFREDPTPFYDLSRDLLPSNFKPTPMHHFIKLLDSKDMLLRCYTQNIDTLERRAGVSGDKVIEAHGSFATAKCTSCQAEYSQEYFRDRVINMSDGYKNAKGEIIPWCKCTGEVEDSDTGDNKVCDGNVKPDIVFFGEDLPRRYFDCREQDLLECDLLIIAGTSLKVTPFSHTVNLCNPKAPRILINNEIVGCSHEVGDYGLELNMSRNYRDVAFIGSCDEGILLLAELIGWKEELINLIKEDNPDWEPPKSTYDKKEKTEKNYRAIPEEGENENEEINNVEENTTNHPVDSLKMNDMKEMQKSLQDVQERLDNLNIQEKSAMVNEKIATSTG